LKIEIERRTRMRMEERMERLMRWKKRQS